jgi:predicted HAD superfamily Cof-like phosphohydrolase
VQYLKSTFACDIAFMPIPDVADFRVEILDSEKQAFLDRMKEQENNALADCWSRLHDVVAKAAQKLNDPKAVFRDSLIENIQDMCQLLPKLNVMDNPELEAMRVQVESLLTSVNPDNVRKSVSERRDTAAKLDDITAKMSAFMSGDANQAA